MLPSTVTMPKPTPRTADHASTGPSASESAYAGAATPSRTRLATRTGVVPNRRSSRGTNSWVTTVAASSTPLTRPAPASLAPPSTAQAGATASSAAYPLKAVSETATSAGMPGVRSRLRRAPDAGVQAQRSEAGTKSSVRSPV